MLKFAAKNIAITFAFCFVCHASENGTSPESSSPPDEDMSWEEEGMLLDEEEVLYGATKYIKHLYEAPASATVITAQEIQKMGAATLADVLERVPGIAITITTPNGHRGIVVRGLKGYEGALVLFNVDHHAVNPVVTGSATWQFLDMPVHNIKRIEVIRGPGSALYGSNAAAAVINILTKNGNIIDGAEVKVGTGSFDRRELSLIAGKRFDDWDISASMNYSKYNASDTLLSPDMFGRSGNVNDRKEETELHFKLNKGPYYASLYYNKQREGGYLGADAVLNDETNLDTDQVFLTLSYDEFLTPEIHLRSTLHYDRWRNDLFYELYPEGAVIGFPDGMLANISSTNENTGLEVQLDIKRWDPHTLTFGFVLEEKEMSDVQSIANFDPLTYNPLGVYKEIAPWASNAKRTIKALYLQDVLEIGETIEATLGVRYDHYSDFGETINPRAAFVWQFSPGTHYKLLYGRAFRAPNFAELYTKNNPLIQGNPDLDPTIVSTVETSIHHAFTQEIDGSVALYRTKIKDIVDLDGVKYKNVGEHKLQGVEVELRIGNRRSDNIYANYTYTDAEDVIADRELPETAKHRGNIGFNIKLLPYLHWNTHLTYSSRLKRAPVDTRGNIDTRRDVGSYKVVDTAFILSDTKEKMYLKASASNLMDEEYEDADSSGKLINDYPKRGRSFFLEAGIRF